MALITQTEWHGNPRPNLTYACVVTNDVSGGQRTILSNLTYSDTGTAVTTTNQGLIAEFAEIEFNGVLKSGTNISLNWITYDEDDQELETRGINGDLPYDCGPTEAANIVSQFINGNVDTQATQAGGVLKIYGVADAASVNCGQIVVTAP